MKKLLLLPLLLIPMFFFHNPVTATEATYTTNQIPNGGFETGTLFGWQSYSIWKGEAGMTAWTNDRVVSGGYFTEGFSYNRDGNYNLGIYGGAISKDSGQERMGHLRSSNFTLGGSGWMSFKLGGGKDSDFAFVSVRRANDNFEVARFGNRHFNDTTLSGTANAEAYMFQYYFDLKTVATLGDVLYIVISDTASNEWCVLSADSFITYYADSLTPTTDQLATNIVPVIEHVSDATNAIVNGNFPDGTLAGWTDVDGRPDVNSTFKIENSGGDNPNRARSDFHNNGDTGVLRSSAFTITDAYDHIRQAWNGGLAYEKQIFISLKEVGTNIEVRRFIRREDKKTALDTGDDNAMLDLTGVDNSKKYYLEYADNSASEYGLTLIKHIRFVDDAEWTSVVASDRAVIISGVPTTFTLIAAGDASYFGVYFIEQTASYCSGLNGGSLLSSGTWGILTTEYNTLSGDAKDAFVGTATDPSILAARARYSFLTTKYSELAANKFVVSSTGVQYSADHTNVASLTEIDRNTMLFMLLGGTALAAFSILFFKRKRQVQ